MPGSPCILEVNARILLRRLGGRPNAPASLAAIADDEWSRIAERFDLLWLMGVWQRSAASRRVALTDSGLRRAYDEALPGWTEEDVAGSPYAVREYALDEHLGEPGDLCELRGTLRRLGLGLILDFIPNHVAMDHPWVGEHPEWFVRGDARDASSRPGEMFEARPGVWIAHGRDPYFPPWTDTAQLDISSAELRAALTRELLAIAEVADGVRCDMAMLLLRDVFAHTWAQARGGASPPSTEPWAEIIPRVKERHPRFVFIAEAYWGLEHRLLDLGFDYVYDKELYDRLRDGDAAAVREHIAGNAPRVAHELRFIENHDERRAVEVFGAARSRAAAVVTATLPGARLFHDGQLEGRRVRLPVQLIREPEEAGDPELAKFYACLLAACRRPTLHDGEWTLLEVQPARAGNESHHRLLAWTWRGEVERIVVVVNDSGAPAQGRVPLPIAGDGAGEIRFRDLLSGDEYVRAREEMRAPGLYVDLAAWGVHLLAGEC